MNPSQAKVESMPTFLLASDMELSDKGNGNIPSLELRTKQAYNVLVG